ncbi:aKG-HExxH-type peptide beta-hydroxylase [Actinoplanes sp. NPDC049599]|uniref:aKG-HExxH-type peptide beta-hydroxylase n=1 Tax=Actinoplanes sp. NPDC049599 TaxID=3363903 RepID=UPI003798CEA3
MTDTADPRQAVRPTAGAGPLRVHSLSDPAFAALGAGRPDAAALAELRRAQLSRHLLLLREIVTTAPLLGYAELAAAEREEPERVRALLARPLVGVWATRYLSALRAGATPDEASTGYLARLATEAGLSPEPAPAAAGRGGVADRGGRVPGQRSGSVAGAARRLTAVHGGLSISVRIEDRDPLRAGLGLTPAATLTDAELARWQGLLTEAWRLLVDRLRPDAEVLATVLDCIVPVEPDPAARGISATSVDAFGAVAMSEPADATALAVGLLHETQHSLLNAVQYLFDLHEQPDAPGYSPWRDDPRPASGILHGAYAYLTVTRFWRQTAGDRLAAFEFARWRAAVLHAAEGLLAGGTLTAAGTRFVSALRAEVRPWLDEPVPADVARLAAGANADHHLRWRLRNLHVDPRDAGLLADAWRQRRPAPGVVAELRPAPRRALEASSRLDLVHATLAGRPVSGRGAEGDLDYVRGAEDAALRAYRKRVVLDPADDAAWAGLALSGGGAALRGTPEVVAALYRTLRDPSADPLALARWISS